MTFHDRVCALAMVLAGALAHAAQPEAAEPDQVTETTVPPAPSPGAIAFNFKDAPFDLVIDFFSRETGLPVIREAEPPSATLTFISAESYGFDEALSILNLNLRMHGLHLRREARFLYLSTLEDAARKPGPFAAGAVPDDLPPDRMVTVTFPLNNALASSIAEQIKPLVGPFGGVTPVESQNMVIVVESADQARRIGRVIRAIDEVPPADSEYRLFVLEHAEPETAVNALKGLVGQREKTIIIDKDGKQRTVDDLTVPGINLQADPRTNAVIAVGPRGRIDVVEELIALIDRPAGDTTAELRTFELAGIEPDEAKKQLDALFAAVPDDRRPRVLPLRDVGKVSVVASSSLLTQAAALLNAMDPDSSAPTGADAARVIPLEHLDATRAVDIADRLLTPAQRRSLRLAPAPDGAGLVVAGPAERIASLAALLAGLDAPREVDRDVRLVRIARGEPDAVLRRALNLYQQTGRADDAPVEARVDDGSRTATLVGPAAAVREVERLIATAAGLDAAAPTPRLYEPEVRKPSELATRLRRLAPSLTIEPDAPDDPPAVFEPLDDLGTLVVRATPRQHSIIEPLIARLDSPNSEDQAFRVMRLSGTNPLDLVERARTLLAGRAESNPSLRGVNAEFDEASGSLLLTGPAEGLDAFSAALEQLRRLTPPGRTTRLIDVRNARAGDVLAPLQDLLASADSIDPARAVPEPTIRVVEATNGLLVTAEDAQHRLIESFVGRLDRLEPTDLPPLKLLQLRSADATQIASMLNDQYRKRAQAERAAKPVDVRSDAATNTLIVSAHESLFDEIKQFVDSINAERLDGPERVTVLFPLKVAKAVDVARAMDTLYPEPPIPLDRRGRPMPWLREPKEVTVTAEPGSNALIIDAPADRVESLRELASKLDRVELPQVAELRTYRIVDADLNAVARTLSNLARRGNLSGPAQPGRQPVDVVIETEPLSGTLIVAGDEITFERVGAMLDDLSAVPTQREVRVAPIANASAEDVRSRALEIYVAQIEGDPRAGEVSVSIDDDSNALMVVGETDDVDRFVGILDQLQRQIGPAREVRLIDLRFATPARVVAFLEDVRDSSRTFLSSGGVDPSFQAIEETGSLLVAAQPDQMPVIQQLIQSLDAEDAAEAPPLRIIRLRTTDASNLAGVLQSAYERRPATERSLRPVDIRADAATNTLIVSAHPEVLPEIESIANELNETQTVTGDDREIRIFPLRIARAEDLARTIDAIFPEPPMPIDPRTRRARPDLRQPREVVVRADRATNSLIVDAPSKRLSGFERIVESLDQDALAGEVELRTYTLDRADLDAAARTLRDLASSGALGAAGRAPVTVNTEPTSRTLVVSGPPAIFPRIDEVLDQLSEPPARPTTGLKMFPLTHGRAERLQPLLAQLLDARLRESEAGAGRSAEELAQLLDVVADPATNTLIVSAPESVLAIAGEVVGALDREGAGAARTSVRVVPLAFAPAAETARALQQAAGAMDLPSGGPVSVTPAPGSNALLLTGAPKDIDAVEALIDPLDQRPSDAETLAVRTFTLEHAEASRLASTIERLLVQQRETDPRVLSLRLRFNRQAALRDPAPPIRVEADPRTNALLVSGPASSVELAASLIDQLDTPATAPADRVLTYTPARATPDELVAAVSRVLERTQTNPAERAELVAEARTGVVLAMGTEASAAEAVRLLMEFDDRTPEAPGTEIGVIELNHADANAIASAVRSAIDDRTRWPESLLRAERAGARIPAPRVTPDRDANRLLVSAPPELVRVAREMASALDRETPAQTVRVFKLSEGAAASVSQAVRSALDPAVGPGEPKLVVSAEEGANAVVVSGSAERVAEAAALIESLDASAGPDDLGARTIMLKNARAETVAPVLERVLARESIIDSLNWWERAQYVSRFGNDEDRPVRVVADARLNALVISGPPAVLDLAEAMAGELDRAPDAAAERTVRSVRVIPMIHGEAGSVARQLTQMFAEDDSGEVPPVISADEAANALIVRATPDQFESLSRLAGELDRAALSAGREVRTIPIDRSRAEAADIARSLQSLLEQRGGVRVEVISAEDLLESPAGDDVEGEPSSWHDRGVGVSPFRSGGRALERVAQLQAMSALSTIGSAVRFGGTSEPPRVGEPDGEAEAPQVTIAVDPVSNSLVVVGSPRLAERIAALAAELEAQAPREPVAVRIIDLPDEADARAVSQLVTQTIRQIGRASTDNPGGFTGRVAAAPDPAGGAVIVWANDTDFASLRSLIAATAQPRTGDALTVKVYPMSNVTARAAAVAVRDLVSAQPQGRQARRMRRLDLALETPEGPTRASIDPSSVRVTPDPGGVSLIVVAPAEAFTLIDGFIALIDQSPVVDRLAIRRYELNNASAGALANTLQRLFDAQRQGPGARDLPRARFVADDRTNAILVTASGDQHDQVVSLLESADSEQQDGDAGVEIFALAQARPSALQRVVEQVVIGRDPAKRERVQMSADDGSNLLLVRAPEEDLVEIRAIVNEVEAADTSGLPIRVVTLDRADPEEVAEALRVFLRDRSRAAGAGRRAAPAAITAHRASRTLIVAASDEAFADVQRLIDAMDTQEQAADFVVRIVRLEHAALADLEPMIDDVSQGISTGFQNNWWDSDVRTAREDRIQVSSNPRTNSFVLIGAVEPVEQLQALIETLDQPEDAGVALTARSVRVETGDLESIAAAVRSITVTPGWTWWRGRDPRAVEVRVDARQRQLILIGAPDAIDAAETVIGQLAASEGGPERVVRTLALEHAQAARAARALRQFFSERARAEGLPRDAVSVVGSADGNVLIVAADEASMPLVESLVAELDRPELGDDRSIEVFGVRNADPDRLAGTLRSMFPQRRAEERVIVTAERTGRAVIVSAPNGRLEEIRGLIARLDQAPSEEETRLVTVPLESARASEVAEALRASLPESLRVRITPVGRSNSLLLAGSPEAIETVRGQIEQLDREPTRSLSEVRRIAIEHAVAEDVWFTLSRLLRGRPVRSGDPAPRLDYLPAENALIVSATAEDLEEIDRMVAQLDRPAERERRTEFVGLEFAEAEAAAEALGVFFGRFAQEAVSPEERSVTVVPDPASNSLVISADESVWPRIEGLLSKLDTAEYDTSRQLAVIPLEHADAESVARALNDGFRPTIEESARAERERRSRGDRRESDRRDDSFALPTVLVAEEGAPVVSAEPETNTLIVFAGRRELDRIRTIVGQLDVPEFARSSPRLIALSSGRASVIAESLSAVFARRGDTSGRAVVIRGDDDASALIVRASEDVYTEIAELARALEAEAGKASPSPAVIRVRSASAARMRSIVLASVRPIAERLGEPFVVEADLAGNALVVTASEGIIEEVRRLVSELDGEPVADGGDEAAETGEEVDGVRVRSGQSMLVVDLEHQSPAAMGALIERLGVTQAATANGLGLVESAVRVTPLSTRTAVALVGQERDVAIIASLVRVLDGEPDASEQAVGLVALRYASADAMAKTLRRMLMPTEGSSGSGQGAALAEHVRRLALRLNDVDAAGAAVDLTAPIRLIPDQQTNSLLIASTPANLQIVKSLVQMLDTLPLGDAVLVRIFPLDHAAAVRVRPILIQLFREGEALRRLPGTQRRGLPSTTTGQALASEISVSVDERTNSLIVAGREEAVALVEVLIADLDSDRDSRWVEPAIIQLAHADAASLAETLRDVLVNAESTTPEAEALRRQVGRLRIAMSGDGAPAAESDVYVPLGSLVIRAEENANALLVVGSPANLLLVRELVGMLDVEAAAAGNVVRVYPLEHAAAERVAGLASEVFRQREEAGAIRRQDRLTVAPDTRTNALIVSTSTRGFAIFETLLRTLDAPDANFSVGLHVLAVENADAGRLAPRIERLMRERIDASRRAGSVELPTDALRIEADEANNLLIVAASDENLAVIQELLDAMTRGDATGAELTELITVRSGRAEEVARTVRELYADRENERRGDRSVSVVANDRLNAVIISGEAGDIDAARRLIEDLESAQVTALQDVRRIELQAANALEVVNLIRTVLAGRPITGARGGNDTQATRLRFFKRQLESELETELGGMAGEAELDEAIRGQVRLTPDLRTNSVVVAAPPAVLELIEAIIDDLDTTTAGSRKIEIFELVNADARAMSVVLRDLFNLSQQGERFVLIPTQTSIETSGDTLSLGETTLTPVPDERQELSITIDARTNTLLVSGTAEYLDLVREVVEGLDDIEANERESFVYHLQNAKADEAEGTLQNYFESEARRVRELLGPDQAGSALRQLEQEVTVVGDVASNKLVVSASPRYVEAVERIIGELDAAPPQVMIQVLLAEVTLDEDDTWGADFEVGPLGGQAYQVATSAASGGLATAIGTPNLSVTTADFSLLVRALEVQGKLEVLSRPQVTVNNNEPAFIQVGEDVAIVSGVERLESGNTRSDVERRDVGIILNVTPSISNDGFVRMEISPEISTVTTRTTQISEDFEAPIISQRRIETTVTVQDGETVVIGGLIQTTDEERVSKVPLLGDIPILGVPFRATQRSRVKTELLVILTPVVIPGDSAEGLRAFRVRTEQSIDEMWKPGRIREAVRGAPSPALERPLPLEPVGATREERELWDSGDDSLFPRSRRNGASP